VTTYARNASGAPWTDGSTSPTALTADIDLPQTLGYRVKRRLLGQPLTRESLKSERLSKRLALGVLSSDCISSSAYGTEEMLIVLVPAFGVAAFAILLPLTGVVLAVLLIVTLSYRDVVSVYTKTGGSYVVARENFGPVVAQVAAVALMLDYIVTVAVQTAAGTAALVSAVPSLDSAVPGPWPGHWALTISGAVVLLLFYGNLRGVREAGRTFAFPTYFFAFSVVGVIVVGIVREILGDLPRYALGTEGTVHVGQGQAILGLGAVYVLLRAFANGGSSLTGLEAVSNGVSVFKRPEGRNARKTLVIMSVILGTLVLGVSWLAHETHAVPYSKGFPTVIAQVTKAALGTSPPAHIGFLVVQVATMLILWTGANTPFSGFPFLASFVAEDRFLPRQLTRRGHRLAFSNGIIVLGAVSMTLLLATDAHVDRLVAFYAIGVFTGFTLAGLGMAKHFAVTRQGHWRRKFAVNLTSGIVSAVVVVVFAVVKFTEGAWLVVILFPIGVLALIRLNRQYRRETQALAHARPTTMPKGAISRHTLVILVDEVDLASLGAVAYGRSLRPTDLRAVHFVIDAAHAEDVRAAWGSQIAVRDIPLYLIDCPDRRLARAALKLAARESAPPGTEVTILLPRRTYAPFLGRLLHDQTADDIARAVSRLPRVVATIVPFDVNGLLRRKVAPEEAIRPRPVDVPEVIPAELPEPGEGATRIGDLAWRGRATVEGQVRGVRVAPLSGAPSLEVELWDPSGGVTLVFYGRRSIPGIEPGARLRATGTVGELHGCLAVANPRYELVGDADESGSTSALKGNGR
jgi:amino acid transporter